MFYILCTCQRRTSHGHVYMAVACPFFDNSAIRYVLPVLWLMFSLLIIIKAKVMLIVTHQWQHGVTV